VGQVRKAGALVPAALLHIAPSEVCRHCPSASLVLPGLCRWCTTATSPARCPRAPSSASCVTHRCSGRGPPSTQMVGGCLHAIKLLLAVPRLYVGWQCCADMPLQSSSLPAAGGCPSTGFGSFHQQYWLDGECRAGGAEQQAGHGCLRW
jgi:hypothetical protein